jgi:hypothetical protein
VKPGESRQIVANETAAPRTSIQARATDGWHFSGDALRFSENHPTELFAQLGQLGLVLLSSLYYGALPATLVEAAPTPRCARPQRGPGRPPAHATIKENA